jgi:hypothetical protein
MTQKEKALELVDKFENIVPMIDGCYSYQEMIEEHFNKSKQCALIAVEEILDLNLGLSNCDQNNWETEKFYEQVKKEIEKL